MSDQTQPPINKDPSRAAALQAIQSIIQDGANLDETLQATRSRLKDPRDRGFHHQLVMVVMRHFGEINAVLDTYLERRPKGRAAKIMGILQMGIAQVLYLDVPDFAAVSTSVDLARQSGLTGHTKLVNAIMRRVVGGGRALLATLDSEKLNTPTWMWDSWLAAYGEATCRAIAKAHTGEAKIDVSVKTDPASWAVKLDGELLPTGSIRLSGGRMIESLAGFDDGQWWVQDAAAALPVKLLGDVNGKTIADLCAAPGGKTMQLVAAGASVTAIDRSKKRLKVLHRNLYRTHLKATVLTEKAEDWKPDELLDGVLLDAPCSATGTLRRHPDIAFQKSPDDIASLTAIQNRLLIAALEMVKPGGLVIYCTCSLQPEEGETLIANALANGLPAEIVPVRQDEVPELSQAITSQGALRTLPCHWAERGGLDGFYAVRLRKI